MAGRYHRVGLIIRGRPLHFLLLVSFGRSALPAPISALNNNDSLTIFRATPDSRHLSWVWMRFIHRWLATTSQWRGGRSLVSVILFNRHAGSYCEHDVDCRHTLINTKNIKIHSKHSQNIQSLKSLFTIICWLLVKTAGQDHVSTITNILAIVCKFINTRVSHANLAAA